MLGYIDPCLGLIVVYLLLVGLAIGSLRLLRHILNRGSVAVIQMDSTTFLEMADGGLEFRPRRLRTWAMAAVFGLASIGVIWMIVGLIMQKNPTVRGWLDTLQAVLFTLIVLGIIIGAMSQLIPRLRSRVIRIDGPTGTVTVVQGTAEERIAATRVTDVRVGASPGPGFQSLNSMFGSIRCDIELDIEHRESLILGTVSARPDRARVRAHAIAAKVEALVRPSIRGGTDPA